MRLRAVGLLAALALGLAGCGKGAPSEWQGPPTPDGFGQMAVADFNAFLDSYPDGGDSPEALTAEYLGFNTASASATSIDTIYDGEPRQRADVVVRLDNIPDDSIRSVEYNLVVSHHKAGWRLDSASRTIACREGRGHTTYSVAECL